MNKDYLEYQYSKSKKLTERAFKLRIGMLVVSMLACAGIMASSAFALFKCDINRSTTLTAAQFEVLEFNPVQMQSDEQNVINVIHIVTTPGVLGYCKIPVYGTDNTTRYYYTEPFVGEIYFKIATAVGTGIGVPEAFWGNPRNVLDPEIELLGIGTSVVHSYAAPETEASSGGGGQDVSQEQQDNETENKQPADETENNDEVLETPMLSVSPSVNKEQTTVTESAVTEKEITSVVEKSETTVTSSVSETPVQSTPPSDNNSDSGTSDSSGANVLTSDNGNSSENSSSGNSSDSGNSSGSLSSGSDASPVVTSSSSSDNGGE